MELTKKQVRSMLTKAKKARACSNALTEIRHLLDEGGTEAVIASEECSYWVYWYAKCVIKGRWLEAEDVILKNAFVAQHYARDVIKGRWLEAEDLIRTDAWVTYMYARDVIKARWPEAEDVIRKDAEAAYGYARHFQL